MPDEFIAIASIIITGDNPVSEPYIGQIIATALNFAPRGFATCDGQLLNISQNTAMFSILGTTYGGDGKTTFALPNMLGRVPIHAGQGAGLSERTLGETGGENAVWLHDSEMPRHTHQVMGVSTAANTASPQGATWALEGSGAMNSYAIGLPTQSMYVLCIAPAGGSMPHNNMPPYLGLTFVIAIEGLFPSRN